MQGYEYQEELLNTFTQKKNSEELHELFRQICEHYFIEKFAIANFAVKEGSFAGFQIFDTYPGGWIKHYLEKQYYLHDPVFSTLGKIRLPYSWESRKMSEMTPTQQRLFSEAADYNIKFGTTIPFMPTAQGQTFLTIIDHVNIHPEILYVLNTALQLYENRRFELKIVEKISTLTPREYEILELKSQGIPLKCVADKLQITEVTTNFHLKNIKQKLNAKSIDHALYLFGLGANKE